MDTHIKIAGAVVATIAIAGTLAAWYTGDGPEKLYQYGTNAYSTDSQKDERWVGAYVVAPIALSVVAGAVGFLAGAVAWKGVQHVGESIAVRAAAAENGRKQFGLFRRPNINSSEEEMVLQRSPHRLDRVQEIDFENGAKSQSPSPMRS